MRISNLVRFRAQWSRIRNLLTKAAGYDVDNKYNTTPVYTEDFISEPQTNLTPETSAENNAIFTTKLDRELVANLYIKGDGIEIGALHNPLKVPSTANVKYVDRMSVSDLRQQYPELNSLDLVNVDIIADGELLETIPDSSQDFIIINHFLEHCQNPILALSNMFRVLKEGGILYIAVPDKRFPGSYDFDRPITTLEHLWKDYNEGPTWSKRHHFEEWVRLVGKRFEDEVEFTNHVNWLLSIDYSIHYHVWTQNEVFELLSSMKKVLNLKFDIELFFQNGTYEIIFILRKQGNHN